MMTTRASVIAWSTGAGLLLGVFIDALLVGVWLVVISILPSIASLRAAWPRLTVAVFGLLLAAIPLVAALLGFFEGRLKTS